ncbi:MAG: c-type cytochrome biogenesis protein CcmI [Alphaproteobacteria bacterium]|nr:c-type cytochrome biogenesis protein CcmI [Alphaproteobacteria bacterium]
MILFWTITGVATLLSLAAVLWPLMRRRADAALAAADYDVAVYRSQLEEVGRDAARGQLSKEEAEAARTEIGRRLLEADRRRDRAERRTSAGGLIRGIAPYAVAAALPAAAFGLYLELGLPGAPDVPLAARDGELRQAASLRGGASGAGGASLAEAAEGLRARLQENPDDFPGWVMLGRTEMTRGAYAEAVEAFERAADLAPPESRPGVKSELGEALTLAAEGVVTARAQSFFREAVAGDPADLRAEYYLAEADFQAGRLQQALDRWMKMATEAPPGAPYLTAVTARARAAAGELGVDVADRLPAPAPLGGSAGASPGPTPGPSQEDVAAAQAMSPEERQAMIEGMVEGLSARLAAEPMDLAGWERLIRSYMVLERPEEAQAALDRALGHFAAAPVPTGRLAALAGDLGLTAPEAAQAQAPRGPSADDVAAAQGMTEAQRRTMIQGMVEGLAARLEEAPDDLQGWTMLGRSYRVLGRSEEALAAFERATALDPDSVDLLIERARVMRALAGERQTPETVALMRRTAELDPDNVEANWFLGLDALKAGDREEAARRLNRAVASLPEGSQARRELSAEVEGLLAE